ncbi:ribosomal RNA small subunit methyltransferase A [bacterium]|nr:MAG: ribosomal RNA small subunit methyltransferase A [bacterium]
MTPETLKQLLMDYGLSPNKTYGQHFLMDEIVLQDMLDSADVSNADVIVEVGPGIGNLTKFLIDRAGQVLAIEKDPQFVNVLNSLRNKNKNFSYVLGDVLEENIDEALAQAGVGKQSSYKVVANIPYYVTGKIVQYFLKQQRKPVSMTLLMQKEVAQNITAKEGNLNLLAISVQLYATAELAEIVRAEKFYPAPKVDSAVITIKLHEQPKYDVADEQKLFKLLRACFTGKRKQIHNTLVSNLGLGKEQVAAVLKKVNLDPKLRPQQLSIEQWIKLSEQI